MSIRTTPPSSTPRAMKSCARSCACRGSLRSANAASIISAISPRGPAQRAAFIAQLEIAAACGKPVFLHQRDAHEDFAAILAEHRSTLAGGAAHCFTGGPLELEAYLALGLSIGVTGWVCDERRGASLREAVPRIPIERLMIETDAPYLLPRDLEPRPKSRRNEPAYLPHIARTVASLRGESPEALAEATTRNCRAAILRAVRAKAADARRRR